MKRVVAGVRVRVPVNGVKTYLWAINREAEVMEAVRGAEAASKAGDIPKVTLRNASIAEMYLADTVKSRAAAAVGLNDTFDPEPGEPDYQAASVAPAELSPIEDLM